MRKPLPMHVRAHCSARSIYVVRTPGRYNEPKQIVLPRNLPRPKTVSPPPCRALARRPSGERFLLLVFLAAPGGTEQRCSIERREP